jgi:hypothetical protein
MELNKDYDLEVHYLPGKVNVVVDALSRKAQCNYLPTISITREESSVQVTPDMGVQCDPHPAAERGNHCSSKQ